MGDSFQFANVLSEYVKRSGYTPGQLSKLSSIPKPTIVNWLEGRVRKPRGVEDLLLLATALHLSEVDATRLLMSAGHPSIENLRTTAVTTQNNPLLQQLNPFQVISTEIKHVPFQAFADMPTFVGRQAEIDKITQLFLSSQTPKFVSIQGMGGIGKTALAIHVAHQTRHIFTDGVLWAKVSQSDTASILYAFALSFGADIGHLSDPYIRSQAVRDLLANKNVLLILDDAETSAQISPLLPPALRGAVIWTTRRQDLSIFNQAVQIQVRPFTPQGGEAVALFGKVLGEKKVEVERPYFEKICHILGYHPLAIDIAASRLAYEPGWIAQEFLETLQQESSLVEQLKFEAQDIRLSFLASYDRLDEKIKAMFQNLTIFGTNDFTAKGCAEIFDLPLSKVNLFLRQLYGLSLIAVGGPNPKRVQPRYRLHAIINDFLSSQGTISQYKLRFALYYLNLLKASPNDFQLITREYPLLLTSLSILEEKQQHLELMQLTNQLFAYWDAIGDFQLARLWLEKSLKNISQNSGTQEVKLDTIFNLGRLHERLGNMIEADSYYGSALILARQLQLTFQHSHILRRLGVLASQRSDFVLAEAYYKEGIQLARRINGGNAVSDFLRGLGVQAYMMGQFAKAESFYEEGLALMHLDKEQIRQPQGEIGRIWGLGTLAQEQGDYEQAELFYESALVLAKKLGNRKQIIRLLRSMASLKTVTNNLLRAQSYLDDAYNIASEIGSKWQEARIAGELGEIELNGKRYEHAEVLFKRQYELARILKSAEMVGVSMFGLARYYQFRQDHEMAMHYASHSLDAFISIGHESVQSISNWIEVNRSLMT